MRDSRIHSLDLDSLQDVSITPPVADNNILQYNAAIGQWENVTPDTLAGTMNHHALLGLGDDDHGQYWADTTIGTRAKDYATAGIVTAGEYNTTGSTGNTGTIASFGVNGTSVPGVGRVGLVEVSASSGSELSSVYNAGMVIDVNRDVTTVSSADINGAIFAFNALDGVQTQSSTEYGLFGSFTGTITASQGVPSRTTTLRGLGFSCQNNEDWIKAAGALDRTIITQGAFLTSTLGSVGKSIAGAAAVGKNFGLDVNSIMAGTYDADNDGENFGICITVTDSINDASTGDIESVGLEVIAPPTSTHGGGGVLTSWAIRTSAGKHTLGGCLEMPITTVTTTTALDETHYTVICNSATAIDIDLPAVSGITGRIYYIKNKNSGVVSVDPNGTETIDASAVSFTLAKDESITIQADSNGWWII